MESQSDRPAREDDTKKPNKLEETACHQLYGALLGLTMEKIFFFNASTLLQDLLSA